MSYQKDETWQSLADLKDKISEHLEDKGELTYRFSTATNYFQKLSALRDYYNKNTERIIKSGVENPTFNYMSYPIDWMTFFTPIEFQAWCSIRCKGVVFYPQFPVLQYFVDFGNPNKKIAIELDGAAFHNAEKDKRRDKELGKAGWTVYRITGSEMNKNDFKDFYDCRNEDMDESETYDCIKYWLMNTGDGVIEAIRIMHFMDITEIDDPAYLLSLCHKTLEKHSTNEMGY